MNPTIILRFHSDHGSWGPAAVTSVSWALHWWRLQCHKQPFMTLVSRAIIATQLHPLLKCLYCTCNLIQILLCHEWSLAQTYCTRTSLLTCFVYVHSCLTIAQNVMFICHLVHKCIPFIQKYSYIWYVVLHVCAFALILTHNTEIYGCHVWPSR